MITWLRRSAFLLSEPRLGWDVLRVSEELLRLERCSGWELRRLRDRKLARLLAHAGRYSPWYAAVVSSADLLSSQQRPFQMLEALPILTKAAVRAHGSELLVAKPHAQVAKKATTGGSTGEPLVVYKNRETMVWETAALWRGYRWSGIPMGSRGVIIKASGRITSAGRLRARLSNLEPLVAFSSHRAELMNNIERIRRFAPRFVSSYVTPLLKHIDVAEAAGVGLPRVPVILTTGEMLYPPQRARIEEAFGGRVQDYYGSNEVGGIAFECEKGVKHIIEEHVVVETVDAQGRPVRDQPGRLVVTDLDNDVMPMIRYEIGDIGTISSEPCACGRPHAVLRELEGRTQDFLRAPGGRSVPAIYFATRFRDLKSIKTYQWVQQDETSVELRYVAAAPGAEQEARRLVTDAQRLLGDEVRVAMVAVSDIAPTARGKRRLVLGLSARPQHGASPASQVPTVD